jgi:hypothetical protein
LTTTGGRDGLGLDLILDMKGVFLCSVSTKPSAAAIGRRGLARQIK